MDALATMPSIAVQFPEYRLCGSLSPKSPCAPVERSLEAKTTVRSIVVKPFGTTLRDGKNSDEARPCAADRVRVYPSCPHSVNGFRR